MSVRQRIDTAVQRVSLCIACILLLGTITGAQEYRATITGRVMDPQGAALPGAVVLATNIRTNVSTDTITNEQGAYSLAQLPAGEYQLSVELQGFKKFVREGIVLETAEKATINIQMMLGGVEETLTVTAALSSTETNRSTVSQTMNNKSVSELPLNGRQVYMLLQQTPGTLFTQNVFGSTGFSGTRAWDTNGSVSIHGSRTGNNEFLIDGAPNAATGGWQYAPVVDAIEEFKVNTASVDASYGRTSGGIVNMTMKSGTNQFRGSGFSFFRGNALDANSTQNNKAGVPKKDHRYVDGGGVLGGPIVQNKTFFMTFYEGFYENIPFPRTSTVATDLQRLGDFSQTFNGAGQLVTIFDPLTTRPDPNRPGRFVRDPFPGNKIPADRINPVASTLMGFIPRANSSGETFTQANNLVVSPNLGRYRYNSYFARIDHKLSDRHKLTINNTANWGVEFRNQNGFPLPSLRGNYPKHRNHYLTSLDDVLTLNSTTLLDVRASYDRFNDYNPIDYANIQGDLGIKTPFQAVSPAQYPYITIDDHQDFFPGPFGQSVNNIYAAQGSLSKTVSNHFIKTGIEFRSYRLNRVSLGDGNGRFHFQRGFTQRDPQQGDATSGNAFASFLLGYPSGSESRVDVNATSARQYLYTAAYVQDDWKVASRLTLNLGLRYDVQPAPTERYDRLNVGFDDDSPNPFRVPGMNLRGGLIFPDSGHARAPYKTDWSAIQPRVGGSFIIRQGVVARANYGRSYLPLTGGGSASSQGTEGIDQTGFSRQTVMVSSVQTGIPFNTLDRPYPEGIPQPANGKEGLATNIGGGLGFYDRDFKVPYTDQWMAGVSFDLPWRISVDASYVGNRVRRVPTGRDINRWAQAEQDKAIERLGGNVSYLSTQVPNPFAGLVPGTSLNNTTVSRSQLLRPYPQFTGITMNRIPNGHSTYDAFELAVTRRFANGIQANVNYARMRQLEASRYLNAYDTEPFEDISELDRSYRLSITGLFDLPFGSGHALGAGASGLLKTVISGWQVNVIAEFQSGFPIESPNGILRQKSARLPESEQSLDRWFDNSTISNPRPDGGYAWDQVPPNDYRVAPWRLRDVRSHWAPQWALSLFKNTRVGHYMTQFRAEAFNAFNTPIYGTPEVGITNARFGKVVRNQINFPRQIQLGVRVYF